MSNNNELADLYSDPNRRIPVYPIKYQHLTEDGYTLKRPKFEIRIPIPGDFERSVTTFCVNIKPAPSIECLEILLQASIIPWLQRDQLILELLPDYLRYEVVTVCDSESNNSWEEASIELQAITLTDAKNS